VTAGNPDAALFTDAEDDHLVTMNWRSLVHAQASDGWRNVEA
jgi:hypothetical protein